MKLKGTKQSKARVVQTRISHERTRGELHALQWSDAEREKLENRILSLRDDQIGALTALVGIRFNKRDLLSVAREIRTSGRNSGHLSIITDEADSKENLLWWVRYFEEANC